MNMGWAGPRMRQYHANWKPLDTKRALLIPRSIGFPQILTQNLWKHLNIGRVSQILNKIWGNGADPKIQWILTDFDQILWKHFQPKIKKHCSSRIFYLIWQKSNFRWEFFPFLFLCLHLYLNHTGKSSGGWDGLSYFFPSFVGQNVESWYH